MKALTYLLAMLAVSASAQDVIVVMKDSTEMPVTMKAVSDSQIFTSEGNVALADVAYVSTYSDVELPSSTKSRLVEHGVPVRRLQISSSLRNAHPDDLLYHETIAVPGKSKDELYAAAKEWFVYAYKSANNVIQLDDPANGKLIGKGTFTVPYLGELQVVRHTVTIEVKDGKYRYFIDQFSINDYPFADLPKGQRKNLGAKSHQVVLDLIGSMRNYMRKTAPQEDW